MADPTPFTLEESARRLGHYAWTEARLFELIGGWVATVPEIDVKLRIAPHSHHHAWHADLWRGCLPKLREMAADDLIRPAGPDVDAFVAALAEPQAPELTIEKLVGAYRVAVPHLVAAYTHHQGRTSAVADAPTIRTLGIVLRDELDDWREGELALQTLLRTPADVARAAARQAELESVLVAAGGIVGTGSIG